MCLFKPRCAALESGQTSPKIVAPDHLDIICVLELCFYFIVKRSKSFILKTFFSQGVTECGLKTDTFDPVLLYIACLPHVSFKACAL